MLEKWSGLVAPMETLVSSTTNMSADHIGSSTAAVAALVRVSSLFQSSVKLTCTLMALPSSATASV